MGHDGKFRSKLSEGEATILVVDEHMKNNTAEGSINVVFPYRMEVSVRDITDKDVLAKLHAGDNVDLMQAWSLGLDLFDNSQGCESDLETGDTHILIEEHFYRLQMKLFDKEGHRITLTDNLRFKSLNLDAEWIEIVQTNNIGSELVIKTKKIRTDTVKINSQHKLD